MNKPDGGPAFPSEFGNAQQGMSLRDYFAAHALALTQSRENVIAIFSAADRAGEKSTDRLAGICYEIADAMLAERAK